MYMKILSLIFLTCCCQISLAKPTKWKLIYEEKFTAPIGEEKAEWRKVEPGTSEPMDDNGQYFHALGGRRFANQLATFDTYRKTFRFGKDGWLTAELSARDFGKTGKLKDLPSLTVGKAVQIPALLMYEPDHFSGILIRSTKALPARYRIEYELVALDFGGSRNGQWNSPGKINGYSGKGMKTRHPWPFSKSDEFGKPYTDWHDVRIANGFYFLAIVDYPDPFPHNNVFIHNHRKVAIDAYNMNEGATFEACNPKTKTFYVGQDNTVNMLFLSPGGPKEGKSNSETQCGTVYGGENGRAPVVSAVQLQPELMPNERYRFAVERDEGGYTLEISGNFKFSGKTTYRYHRRFMQDGHPIWHFNQRPEEYDGSYDKSWKYEGPFGKFSVEHSWPKGSAYPDYFIIGDPHTNYYEGSAALTNLKMFIR